MGRLKLFINDIPYGCHWYSFGYRFKQSFDGIYEWLRDIYIALSEVVCCTLAFLTTVMLLPIIFIMLSVKSIKAFYYYILFRTGNLSEYFLNKLKRADSRYKYVKRRD